MFLVLCLRRSGLLIFLTYHGISSVHCYILQRLSSFTIEMLHNGSNVAKSNRKNCNFIPNTILYMSKCMCYRDVLVTSSPRFLSIFRLFDRWLILDPLHNHNWEFYRLVFIELS